MMKNVLVTGGTRGLGLAIAGRLASEGYHVIATGRAPTASLEALGADRSLGGRVTYCRLNLEESDQLHSFVRRLTKEHGHLFGLVNNAALGQDGVLATMHDSEITALVRVNLLATILLTKYAARSMLLAGEGRIVNVASIIAFTGFSGLSVYAATKAALVGFSRSLARELGRAGITVNCVSPGYMETDMTAGMNGEKLAAIRRRSPLGKLAGVDDSAGAVAYFLGNDARMITGTNLTVDAGSTA